MLQGVGVREYHKYAMKFLSSTQLSEMVGNAPLDLLR